MSDVTRRMAKSEAQVKATPSKAAMDLAEALFPDFTPEIHVGYADIIQAHVRDLLEKAEAICDAPEGREDFLSLRAALEPWKPK